MGTPRSFRCTNRVSAVLSRSAKVWTVVAGTTSAPRRHHVGTASPPRPVKRAVRSYRSYFVGNVPSVSYGACSASSSS
jgi:hypothetical protein